MFGLGGGIVGGFGSVVVGAGGAKGGGAKGGGAKGGGRVELLGVLGGGGDLFNSELFIGEEIDEVEAIARAGGSTIFSFKVKLAAVGVPGTEGVGVIVVEPGTGKARRGIIGAVGVELVAVGVELVAVGVTAAVGVGGFDGRVGKNGVNSD
jgi:hypothetical protein